MIHVCKKKHYKSKQTRVIPLYNWLKKSCLGATNDSKSMYLFAPVRITGAYIYIQTLFISTISYTPQREEFPGKEFSFGESIYKMGLGIFWG